MSKATNSTRRSFIWTAGAAFSAPLAAAASAVPVIAGDEDPLKRLAFLEDVNAIRALPQVYFRRVNESPVSGGIVGISPDGFGEEDVIEISAERDTATARVHCLVTSEEVIGPSCPLVEMAREQGGGVVRHTARVVVEHACVKRNGEWKIERSTHRPV